MNWFGDCVWLSKPKHNFKIGDRVTRFRRVGVKFVIVDFANEVAVVVSQSNGQEEIIPAKWLELA